MKTNSNPIDSYIKDQPKNIQPLLNKMRTTIKKCAPKAEETIGYGIPTFKLNGNLVHFAGYKSHIGFYPSPNALKYFAKEIAKYNSSKGAVQFPIDKPLPLALITKITKYRVKQNLEKQKNK